MIQMPQEASGDDIIESLMEHMDSEDLIDRFDHFAMHATLSPEDDEDDEDSDPQVEYCVIANTATMPINGIDTRGILVSIWPVALAEGGDFLPAHLSRNRHARFLEVDPKSELVTEMHCLPTLH